MEAEERVRKCRRVSYQADPLWRRLSYMRIEPAGAALTFPMRLAREQGWQLTHAEMVAGEYRRFLYLAGISSARVTPPPAVDHAWHLHLAYSRHYWSELCSKVLRKELHHIPSDGGADDAARLRAQYADTLALYEATFGLRPPPRIWPPAEDRYPEEQQFRINRASIAAAGVALAVAGASLLGAGPPSPDVSPLRLLIFMTAVAAFFVAIWWALRMRFRDEIGCGGGFLEGTFEGGCGGGGCGGCGG